ncbi:efflux transporter outer membrane subunit [Mucilaginibacter calamicampi]|uniref:Efflux transporter outer membrane subunit n=1 Tax=Mucilaginibacter calamicampi TaxID=1302352 RepID=A0ABW2YV24_9SPHI
MKKYLTGLALITLIISACSVSKDIATPKPETPVAFRSADVKTTGDSSSIADIQWRQFFTEPVLQRLIDSAIINNYDMQLAVKNLEQSQLVLKQSKWNNVPEVNLNVGVSSSRPSDNSLNGISLSQFLGTKHIENYSADVSLSWEADIWGKIRNQNKIALASYLKTNEAKKFIQTNIVAGVAQGYYNLLMLDRQLAVAKRNVQLNDSTLQIIQLQYNAGQVTSLGVQQAEAQRLAAARLVPQFEQAIALQENALRILTGALPDKVTRNATLDQFNIPDNISTGVPSVVISRRPDVRSAEFSLNIANANVGVTKAEMYPALRITADGGVNSFKASNWFNVPASLFGIVAGSVVEPLINKKRLSTNYNIAQVEREKVVLQFRQTVLNAVGEVSNSLASIEKLKEAQVIATQRVSTLQQATGNANLLFRNGMANYLEVITAQSNVLQSELELATIKRDELNAVSSLYRALGGGWQ